MHNVFDTSSNGNSVKKHQFITENPPKHPSSKIEKTPEIKLEPPKKQQKPPEKQKKSSENPKISPEQLLHPEKTSTILRQNYNKITITVKLFDTINKPFLPDPQKIPIVILTTFGRRIDQDPSKFRDVSAQYTECKLDSKNEMVCEVRLHYTRTEYNFELEILFDPKYMSYSGRPYLVALETGYKGNQVHGETHANQRLIVINGTEDVFYRDVKNSKEVMLTQG